MFYPIEALQSSCAKVVSDLTNNARVYGLEVSAMACGATLVDGGVNAVGSYKAGALVTELCQGGLSEATIQVRNLGDLLLPHISVETYIPRCANLLLQSAREFEGEMISGPIKMFLEADGPAAADCPAALVAVLQCDKFPEDAWVEKLAKAAGCKCEELTLVVVPQGSAAGSTQIAGRMNENVLFTMERSLGYDSSMVRHIIGYCPVGPYGPAPEGKKLLLPDDYLHYASGACLHVEAPEGLDIQKLADDLAFNSLSIYGKLFYELLEEAGWDFFKIPDVEHINKLAEITICDIRSGKTAVAGRKDIEKLTCQLI